MITGEGAGEVLGAALQTSHSLHLHQPAWQWPILHHDWHCAIDESWCDGSVPSWKREVQGTSSGAAAPARATSWRSMRPSGARRRVPDSVTSFAGTDDPLDDLEATRPKSLEVYVV